MHSVGTPQPQLAHASQLPLQLPLHVAACCGRDDARSVLVTLSVELGGSYLPFVLDVLQSALPPKGYMGPVLGYTLHAVLAGLVKVPPSSAQLAEPPWWSGQLTDLAGHGRQLAMGASSDRQISLAAGQVGSLRCLGWAGVIGPCPALPYPAQPCPALPCLFQCCPGVSRSWSLLLLPP